jgi:microcystin-dependent protein
VKKALDYAVVKTLAENDVARFVFLRPTSFYVLSAVLEAVQYRIQWQNLGDDLSDSQWDEAQAWVAQAASELMGNSMIGMIAPFWCRDVLPEGWLICDGTAYDKEDYPNLWAVTPDSKRGDDWFTVPNLINRFVYGGGYSEESDTGGESSHTLTVDEIPSHNHGLYLTGDLDVEGVGVPQPNAAQLSPVITLYTASTGGGNGHNNIPPYLQLVYGIAAW